MHNFIKIVSDSFQNLSESRGLAARRPGEIFKSTTDDSIIRFNHIAFYPESGGAYAADEFADAVNTAQEELGSVQISWVNKPPKTGGFGVAVFDTDTGKQLAFGRYFAQIKADPMANAWDNKTGVPGYRYASAAAEKTAVGMTPQDVLLDQINLTADSIVSQIIAKFGDTSPLSTVTKHIAGGGAMPYTFAAPGINFTAFRDYFCELLHPIALQQGQYTGSAAKAAAKFLGNAGFENTRISFGVTKTEGLSDSIMHTADGKHVKVSSKGAKGATASVKNLVDAANELASSGNTALLQQHQEIITLVKEIQRAGQRGAPLLLGVKYRLISADDAAIVESLYNKPLVSLERLLTSDVLSAKLKQLAKSRQTNNTEQVNSYYHLLAAIAHEVAAVVNNSTDFSKSAIEILNNGSLVQVYTKVTQNGTNWTLHDFDTVYPSKTVTGVFFRAGKTYYSSGIKGNFTFEILRNKAAPADPDDNGDTTSGAPPSEKVPTATVEPHAATGIKPRRAKRNINPDAAGVGRELQ